MLIETCCKIDVTFVPLHICECECNKKIETSLLTDRNKRNWKERKKKRKKERKKERKKKRKMKERKKERKKRKKERKREK